VKKRKTIYNYNKHPPKKQPKKLRVHVSNSKTLDEELQSIYLSNGDLSTTCIRQCNCCRVACPQMNYSEVISIIDFIWSNWNSDDKKNIILTSIKYFFSKQLIKPCPMLSDNECLVYDKRPIACRLYGLWPSDLYEKRVERVSNAIGIPKNRIPLNTQCKFVKLNSGKTLNIEQINNIYEQIDKLDLHLIMKGDLEKKEEIENKIKTKWNYRTIHDWILFLFFGEEWLVKLTSFSLAATKENIDEFIQILEKEVIPSFMDKKI